MSRKSEILICFFKKKIETLTDIVDTLEQCGDLREEEVRYCDGELKRLENEIHSVRAHSKPESSFFSGYFEKAGVRSSKVSGWAFFS